MTEETNPRAVIGGNVPPAFDPDILAGLRDELASHTQKSGEWLEKGAILTEEDAGRANDHVSGLRKLKKRVDEAKTAAKRPHDEAGKAVLKAFTPLTDAIEAAIKAVLDMSTAYMVKKKAEEDQRRREAEAKARAEREAAEQAAAKAAQSNDFLAAAEASAALKEAEKNEKAAARIEPTRVGSATGGGRTMALRKYRYARITSINALFAHYRNTPEVAECLLRLANADIRAADVDDSNIPGIEIIEEEKAA